MALVLRRPLACLVTCLALAQGARAQSTPPAAPPATAPAADADAEEEEDEEEEEDAPAAGTAPPPMTAPPQEAPAVTPEPAEKQPAEEGPPDPDAVEAARLRGLKKAKPETEDNYLSNWRKYEHRDERSPGRGPMGRKIGFGMALGRPVSVGLKVYFTQTVGVQIDVGTTYSWYGPEVSAQGHVVWHPYTFVANDHFKLSAYIGSGARGAFWPLVLTGVPSWVPSCTEPCRRPVFIWIPSGEYFPGSLGIQPIIGGLDLQLQKFPIELYVQGMPTIEVFPGFSDDLGLQMGARWYAF